MGSVIANLFANKELKDRILFTFMMFVIFRLGVHIPVPGVDASVIESLFTSGNLFGFLDLFSGGALSKFSIFAMSITPYINSSIIMQLLTAVIPTLEEWRKDGQEGFKKIQKVTRYFTIFLAAVQAFGMTYALRINNALVDNSWLYFVFVVVVLTAARRNSSMRRRPSPSHRSRKAIRKSWDTWAPTRVTMVTSGKHAVSIPIPWTAPAA